MISSTTTTTTSAAASSSGNNVLRAGNIVQPSVLGAQFREIHKNTWLKRLTSEGKKITVGPKKSERSWVVFCVHDDTEALLEGYAEPRQAPAHSPEWIVSLRHTLHVSHALIPNSHEFEFVVALNNEVVRFHATSWEIMQEWVETLRAKLREMKILSPRENLYTKLPEVRLPLLPTRDPTSPLPAPPPVPAALVPGVERVVTHNVTETTNTTTAATTTTTVTSVSSIITTTTITNAASNEEYNSISTATTSTSAMTSQVTPKPTAMSNTLTQNLLNLLTDPITAYSENINATQNSILDEEEEDDGDDDDIEEELEVELRQRNDDELCVMSTRPKSQPENWGVRNSTRVSIKAPAAELPCENFLPRISAGRSSVEKCNKSACEEQVDILLNGSNNITELQISGNEQKTRTTCAESSTNITIIEVSSHDNQEARKANAEIFQFPDIIKRAQKSTTETNDYKCNVQIIPSNGSNNNNNNNNSTVQILPTTTTTAVTTVHVAGDKICANSSSSTVPVYGTCFSSTPAPPPHKSPFMQKRIIVSASSSSGVTNITVNDKIPNTQNDKNKSAAYYDKVFLSTSTPKTVATQTNSTALNSQPSSSRVLITDTERKSERQQQARANNCGITIVGNKSKTTDVPTTSRATATSPQETSAHMPRLLRGATEAVITRASRRDAQIETPHRSRVSIQNRNRTNASKHSTNNNEEVAASAAELERKSIQQQRRRSASTSDAHTSRNGRNSNNNELNNPERSNNAHGFRMQPPPHVATEALINSPKRLTLREQQVMQLRREIMHPGGVRLQLRRKDCVGSIAWVDCMNTVWVAGWKQKEHPVLYNALHIGDQLLSIAGVAVGTAAEANKIIRNANTLFVEVLIRRIPFGRGYAIRREREGQCLGLIRDGNTATIVDVVPNSLAARHGLPPKAQSCDGNALTFWVLTEINGRPLNLFFKENEIRDRLNSVGRDISILVQPADLISKLKKQLKSLRGYKDYLVQ